ncbi:hypothetical protein AAES_82357 [Amazona aestiva]|uniref:Uncharacterized protein n=1 Tax=Amazona aestiva TaxID=12930 RepID=A0A0Q3MG21_AMAAE|nr:hypothetical protein AAES_82357 [Amazona aestiva]
MPLGSLGWSEGGKAIQGKGKQNPFRNAAKPESSGDPLQSMPAGHDLLLTPTEEPESRDSNCNSWRAGWMVDCQKLEKLNQKTDLAPEKLGMMEQDPYTEVNRTLRDISVK